MLNMTTRQSKYVLELDGEPKVSIGAKWETLNEATKFANRGRTVRILIWTPDGPTKPNVGQYKLDEAAMAEWNGVTDSAPGDYDEDTHISLQNFQAIVRNYANTAG